MKFKLSNTIVSKIKSVIIDRIYYYVCYEKLNLRNDIDVLDVIDVDPLIYKHLNQFFDCDSVEIVRRYFASRLLNKEFQKRIEDLDTSYFVLGKVANIDQETSEIYQHSIDKLYFSDIELEEVHCEEFIKICDDFIKEKKFVNIYGTRLFDIMMDEYFREEMIYHIGAWVVNYEFIKEPKDADILNYLEGKVGYYE